jgi:hypothetical protein
MRGSALLFIELASPLFLLLCISTTTPLSDVVVSVLRRSIASLSHSLAMVSLVLDDGIGRKDVEYFIGPC